MLVPVLDRPHRVQPLLESIDLATPEPFRVLFLCDPDDQAEQAAVRTVGADMLICGGSYARKINAGVKATDEPLIFLGADDLHFHPGWLTAAAARVAGRISVVGTQDLGNRRVRRGQHATHSLVTRAYTHLGTIDEPGCLLHEGYHHNFVDDEFVGTAKARRVWAFEHRSVVEHLHPNWTGAESDATYDRGQRSFELDRRHFRERRHLWRSR